MIIAKNMHLRNTFVFLLAIISGRILADYTPDPRYANTASLIGNNIYYFGGTSTNNKIAYNDFFFLNLENAFKSNSTIFELELILGKEDIPSMYGPTYAVGENSSTIFLFGGWVNASDIISQSQVIYKIYVKPGSTTWSQIINNQENTTTWPSARSSAAAVIDTREYMYIWGGQINVDKRMYVYDTIHNVWHNPSNSTASVRFNYTATLLGDGRILYIGGSNSSTLKPVNLSQILIYDTVSLQWSTKTVPNTNKLSLFPRDGHTSILSPDEKTIIIYGGLDVDDKTALLLLDTTSFSFSYPKTNAGPNPVPAFHTSILYKNFMIVSFGLRNGSASSDVNVLEISNSSNYRWLAGFDYSSPSNSSPKPSTNTPSNSNPESNNNGSNNSGNTNSTKATSGKEPPSSSTKGTIGIIFGILAGLSILGGFTFWYRRRRDLPTLPIFDHSHFSEMQAGETQTSNNNRGLINEEAPNDGPQNSNRIVTDIQL
ncbi:2239_t:CDS:2 [Ambispora leptoticha]|uniref:2239_t:CDS:1 n=1 Tax=Ambispora leptoticha TaxID=144679 RepID=A0A9N9B6K6_9GLOM|nr:2239_t:CDS:2 [Ambispora leptoticha]